MKSNIIYLIAFWLLKKSPYANFIKEALIDKIYEYEEKIDRHLASFEENNETLFINEAIAEQNKVLQVLQYLS